jgi:hypothetical protein
MKTRLTLFFLVLSLTAAQSQPDERIARSPKINYDWQPGLVVVLEGTGASGLAKVSDPLSKYYYGFSALAGYQFSRNIKAAAGAGVHIHNGGTLFPLYLDLRLNLNSQEIIPFISGAGGVMLDFNELDYTRVFINPLLGVRFVIANKTAVAFSSGVMVSTGGPAERKSYINFKLGVELKGKE